MNIKSYEFKKIITSPIIIALMIIFISFNFFIIYQNRYYKDELKVLNKIVDKVGHEIDDNMMAKFKIYYEEELNKVNEITYNKTFRTYKSAFEILESLNYNQGKSKEDIYSKSELDLINEVGIIEAYYNTIEGIDDTYEKLDFMQIAEGEIKKYRLSGAAAETVRKEYEDFAKRFHQLIKNEEHKNLFFMGRVYRMHSLLFKTLFRSFIFEIMILSVLITAFIVNYEFDNSTHLLAYSSKKGRGLIVDKFLASMVTTLLIATLIMGLGLLTYFLQFDYYELWQVPISSYFNAEYDLPYMSWWNMSFIQYLLLGIGVIYICSLIFNGIAFIISRFVKNSYIVFFIFAILFGLVLVLPRAAPTHSNLIFLGAFTPFMLIMNSFVWFMESGAFTTFKYYEFITLSLWGIITISLSGLSIKSFKKEDIY
ncbi:ABC transporter permease subunit [Desnuesiella massiliensis]|uniref:ABC transporter permease subunit n=1 Tax=Desnuesiella massiliensis TaxID=1650662 RepID=UPI0006E17514|nr:ABC transporter permease subunit [Desnuesiella massiliensis]